jgi:hypothetical protein
MNKDRYRPGQHLAADCFLYSHHGIYAGGDSVIHYTRDGIVLDDMETFSEGWRVAVIHHPYANLDDALNRAYSRLGEQKYNLLFNNCESFCNWCHSGGSISYQVINVICNIADWFQTL